MFVLIHTFPRFIGWADLFVKLLVNTWSSTDQTFVSHIWITCVEMRMNVFSFLMHSALVYNKAFSFKSFIVFWGEHEAGGSRVCTQLVWFTSTLSILCPGNIYNGPRLMSNTHIHYCCYQWELSSVLYSCFTTVLIELLYLCSLTFSEFKVSRQARPHREGWHSVYSPHW